MASITRLHSSIDQDLVNKKARALDGRSIQNHTRKIENEFDRLLEQGMQYHFKDDRHKARVDVLDRFVTDMQIALEYARQVDDKGLMKRLEDLDLYFINHAKESLEPDDCSQLAERHEYVGLNELDENLKVFLFEWGFRYLEAAVKIGLVKEEVMLVIEELRLTDMRKKLNATYGY